MAGDGMTGRFREPETLRWLDPVLVVCPRCGRRATVTERAWDAARLLCPACPLVREWARERLHVTVGGRPVVLRPADGGGWVDPGTGRLEWHYECPEGRESRFGVPLWLRTECCGGHLLWATNEAHLDYLDSYIGAALRERPPGPSGLSWHLPGWMKQAKHRDEVLRSLARLRASLGDG